ncbi:hypothetical protein ACQEU5_08705 [Marinactinospora thermotolerans]|uniref:hypothetical protein n=1 Tax=Marinactinospora thermotolerans TaxID=531310 RepID=UPI003D89B7CE
MRPGEARVRVVAEDWRSITYEAEFVQSNGERVVRRYQCALPKVIALRRLRATYIVGLWHEVNGASCNHVRQVVSPVLTSGDEAARGDVVLVARALVETERRTVCGATADSLRVYAVERAVDWQAL